MTMGNKLNNGLMGYAYRAFAENSIKLHSAACEDAIQQADPHKMVERTAKIARLANRVLMVLKQETDNSEDAEFIQHVSAHAEELQRSEWTRFD